MPAQVVKCSKMATGTGLKKGARVALAFAVAGIARGGTEGITTGVELRCLRSYFFDFQGTAVQESLAAQPFSRKTR